ncbi:uncharacterized protein UV8b_02204 [Ustilaginoidea virens]|uniref:Uncharacterized protein n=1 Tax=Ustilaginoidea virens TaxID=1159556 RepID=A0A8E5HME3_USTVR|nr:uncharacterized protein UV8b_02204 [Ustilaginoidea virens]QUC17963.1 hypothetical protein UV8b_02204 [Ustilaginoidea virens]
MMSSRMAGGWRLSDANDASAFGGVAPVQLGHLDSGLLSAMQQLNMSREIAAFKSMLLKGHGELHDISRSLAVFETTSCATPKAGDGL